MTEPNEGDQNHLPKLYTPKEVAERFGISSGALRNRRIRGQIEGIQIAENYFMYTEDQIKNAKIAIHRKRGPKPKKKVEEQPEKEAA